MNAQHPISRVCSKFEWRRRRLENYEEPGMPIGRASPVALLVIAAVAALGSLAACNVPEMVRFPDYVGPAGPAEAQQAAAAESKPPAPPPDAGRGRRAAARGRAGRHSAGAAEQPRVHRGPLQRADHAHRRAAAARGVRSGPDRHALLPARLRPGRYAPPPAQTEVGLLGLTEFLPTGTLLSLNAGETVMKWPTAWCRTTPRCRATTPRASASRRRSRCCAATGST